MILTNHWKVDEKFAKGMDFLNEEIIISRLLTENYIKKRRPISTRLGIQYNKIPVRLRNALFKILIKFKKDSGFPRWPIENYLENTRYNFILKLKEKFKKIPYISFWPKGKFAFALTHDMDTQSSFENIKKIRCIEKKYNFVSSWNVLANEYKINFDKLEELKKENCEIGSHGYNHDGLLSFLPKEKIDSRIKYCMEIFKKFNIRGFRAPQLQKSEDMLAVINNYFEYDSSMADTDILSIVGMRCGCCSIFPYFIKNMVELPLTIPQDYRMIYTLRLDDDQILDVWKKKIDFIIKSGGLVLINSHPDNHLSGSERGLRLYDKILNYISKQDSYHDLPINIAKWWRERNLCKIEGKKIIGSKRAKIKFI